MTIQWNSIKMSTGVAAVDAEHQEWIRRFNDFENALVNGYGTEHVQKLLDFMTEYSETHFVHEEELAGDLDTPEVRLNRQEHNEFRKNLSEMRNWIQENGVSSVEVLSLKMDMEHWLVHHICDVDARVWMPAHTSTH